MVLLKIIWVGSLTTKIYKIYIWEYITLTIFNALLKFNKTKYEPSVDIYVLY